MKTVVKRLIPAIVVIVVMALAACTHNEGDLGTVYGQWKLVSVDVDGMPDESYAGNMYWSFQSSTIEIKTVGAYEQVEQTFGNVVITDETMHLDFPDAAYPSPSILGSGKSHELQIIELEKNRMTLGFESQADVASGYGARTILRFKKW